MENGAAGKHNTLFVLLLSAMLLLSALLLKPFFTAIAWSLIFSMLAAPLYRLLHKKLFRGHCENAAAAAVSVVIVCFMLFPIVLIGIFIAQEAASAYDSVVSAGGIMPLFQNLFDWLQHVPVIGKRLGDWQHLKSQPYFARIAESLLEWLSGMAKMLSKNAVSGAARLILLFAVVCMTSFYLLRDGKKIASYLNDLLPLSEENKGELFARTANIIRAVVYGIVLTGLVQGILGGIGWYFAKLPNPFFFGFMMFICGMIPMVGTPAVWGCAVIYLFASGDTVHALMLLAWCGGVVCTVDNIVRPIFISGGSDINMLVIFLGLFGGLFMWGFTGLFIGPLVLSLAWFLLDIYRESLLKK